MWASPMETHAESLCPLCGEGATGAMQTQRHLGRHLEEIALFALPSETTQSEDEDDGEQHSTDVSDKLFLASKRNSYQDVFCNVCRTAAPINYHCSICSNDDYDICETCYNQQKWCLDHSHPLIKRLSRNNQLSQKQHYYLDRLEDEHETPNPLFEANSNDDSMLPFIHPSDDDTLPQDLVQEKDEPDDHGETKDWENETEDYGSAAIGYHFPMPEETGNSLYTLGPKNDGLYHCPFVPNCNHKPVKLKHHYE
ncbi:hypothetical protein MMC34_000698 [Xylographa carneopallida]|nr:hypothetical protein [Xylographa carneopallida]